MNEYTAGDLVEAVKGDTVIRGRLKKTGHYLWVGDSGRTPENIESYGFTLSIVEKAAVVVVLPVEPWTVIGFANTHVVYQLSGGYWIPSSTAVRMYEAAQIVALHGTDYTVLSPASVTAKKVLDRVRTRWISADWSGFAELKKIATEFGAEL